LTGEVSSRSICRPGPKVTTSIAYFLAEILIILRNIRRVVEREIHHRRFVRHHLQDKAMRLFVNGGPHLSRRSLQRLRRRLLLHLRGRWRRSDEQRDETAASVLSTFSNLIIMSPVIGFPLAISYVAWQRRVAICTPRLPSLAPSSVHRAKNTRLGRTRPGGETDGDVALFGERLQQAYDVARERSASAKRWRARRKLDWLTVIDAIGYGVIRAATGDGRS
jgi:hypothetical protein